VGLQWIEAGYGKVTNPAWVGEKAGAGLTGFVMGALEKASGEHPAVQGWYADFLQNVVLPNASVFSYMVAFGEVAVGLGLILGMLTGIAAFFGVLMNTNFLLAGTVSTNPILALPGILLASPGATQAGSVLIVGYCPWSVPPGSTVRYSTKSTPRSSRVSLKNPPLA
jgi:uncharacterized membrane protein YphA (DoxX/SURF4 family)